MSGLNGWRRLWLLVTGLGVVAALVSSAFIGILTNNSAGSIAFAQFVEDAVSYPGCASFLTTPFDQIREPDSTSKCWSIYATRSLDRDAPLPYTIERYREWHSAQRWSQLWQTLAVLLPLALGFSALLYAAGWLVAWVRRGFQQT